MGANQDILPGLLYVLNLAENGASKDLSGLVREVSTRAEEVSRLTSDSRAKGCDVGLMTTAVADLATELELYDLKAALSLLDEPNRLKIVPQAIGGFKVHDSKTGRVHYGATVLSALKECLAGSSGLSIDELTNSDPHYYS